MTESPTGAQDDAARHQSHAAPAGQAPEQPATASPAGEPKKKTNAGPVVAALAVGALLGGASGAGVAAWTVSANQAGGQTQTSTPQTITVNNSDEVNAVTAVAAKASPSVVTVAVSSSGGSTPVVFLSPKLC